MSIPFKASFTSRPLSAVEAAAYLYISKSYLYQLTSRGAIPYWKSRGGKLISFDQVALDTWLKGHRVASIEERE
jgi:excisionase family DNA binding protein